MNSHCRPKTTMIDTTYRLDCVVSGRVELLNVIGSNTMLLQDVKRLIRSHNLSRQGPKVSAVVDGTKLRVFYIGLKK